MPASIPIRIQRRRTKGWRMPEEAVFVGRPSRWGNPFLVSTVYAALRRPDVYDFSGVACAGLPCMPLELFFHDHYRQAVRTLAWKSAVDLFALYAAERLRVEPTWLDPLKGRSLACWCPLDRPCHADVLLEIAAMEEAG